MMGNRSMYVTVLAKSHIPKQESNLQETMMHPHACPYASGHLV